MKTRFRLVRRGLRGGIFYCVDSVTGQRHDLGQLRPPTQNYVLKIDVGADACTSIPVISNCSRQDVRRVTLAKSNGRMLRALTHSLDWCEAKMNEQNMSSVVPIIGVTQL